MVTRPQVGPSQAITVGPVRLDISSHSIVWRGGSNWTQRHERWVAGLRFEDRALSSTYAHYLAAVRLADAALESVEADLTPWCEREPFGAQVARLAAYRG